MFLNFLFYFFRFLIEKLVVIQKKLIIVILQTLNTKFLFNFIFHPNSFNVCKKNCCIRITVFPKHQKNNCCCSWMLMKKMIVVRCPGTINLVSGKLIILSLCYKSYRYTWYTYIILDTRILYLLIVTHVLG